MKVVRSNSRRNHKLIGSQRASKTPWRRRLWFMCGCACFSIVYLYMSTSLVDQMKEEDYLDTQVMEAVPKVIRQPRSMISGVRVPDQQVSNDKIRPVVKEPRAAAQRHVNKLSLWPNPTIVVGLPKMGTKTIYDYFVCGNVSRVSHYRCANDLKCGLLIHDNVLQKKSPLHGTGAYNIYTQLDITAYSNITEGLPCYFPQVEALNEIHTHHPHSTLILNKRNVTTWVASVKRWFGMHDRLIQCNISGFGVGIGKTDEELAAFYHDQVERVRRFSRLQTTHRLVEVDIDSPTAGHVMQDVFGIDKRCWGHGNNAKEMPILQQPTILGSRAAHQTEAATEREKA